MRIQKTTPMTAPRMPTITDHLIHLPASAAAWLAPATSPLLHLLLTSADLMIATMPNGRQQKRVTRIDHTSLLSGGPPAAGPPIGGGAAYPPPPDPGGGGGG